MGHFKWDNPRSQRRLLTVALLSFVALLGLLQQGTTLCEATARNVVDLTSILPASTGDNAAMDKLFISAFSTGLTAGSALATRGMTINTATGTTIAAAMTAAESAGNVAVIGPFGDVNVQAGLAASTNLVMYGAITCGMSMSAWNSAVMLMKMTPAGEMLAILNHAVSISHARRIGFFYTTGVLCGEDLYTQAVSYLTDLGIESYLVPYAVAHSSSFSDSDYSAYVAKAPGVTLMQGKPGTYMIALLNKLMTDSAMLSRDIFGTFFQQIAISQACATNKATFTGACYVSTSIPPLYLTTAAVTAFLKAVPSASTDYSKGSVMFLGYLTAYALGYAISSDSCTTATIFKSQVFAYYDRAVYEDYVMGYVGPECSTALAAQGAVCKCNQMQSQKTWLVKINPTTLAHTDMNEAHTNLEPVCGISGKMSFSTRFVALNFESNTLLTSLFSKVTGAGLASGTNTPIVRSVTKPDHLFIYNSMVSTAYSAYSQSFMVDAVGGPFDPSFDQGTDTILWSPIYPKADINMYKTNEYHITPTYAQDILCFYQYLNSLTNKLPITGIIRNAASDASTYYMEEGLVNMALYFSNFASVFVEQADQGYSNTYPGQMWFEGYNILIGVVADDLASVATFMSDTGNSASKVYLPYRTLSLVFDTAKTALAKVLDRVYTDANIQYWTISNKDPISVELAFAGALISENPYSFRGNFPTLTLGSALVPPNYPITHSSVTFGPFYPAGELDQLTGKKSSRGRNWGATQVSIVTLTTAFGGTASILFSSYPDADLYEHLTYPPGFAMFFDQMLTARLAARAERKLILTRKPSTTTTTSTRKPSSSLSPTSVLLASNEETSSTTTSSEEPSTSEEPIPSEEPITTEESSTTTTTTSKLPSSTRRPRLAATRRSVPSTSSTKAPTRSFRAKRFMLGDDGYKEPTTKKPVNKQKIMAGVLWAIAGVLFIAFIALLVIYICTTCCNARGAPTDKTKPVTIIHTDVEFGPALSEELPELYQVASQEHVDVVRELIKKHNCYEVKSDGSRFIIASMDPFKAVQLAADIQTALLQHEWTTRKFDDWYRLVEEKLQVENYTNYTPVLSEEEYQALWRGLRVRVGVHSGTNGVRYSGSFKKYRYFGPTVRTSLFVEEMGQGGQSLVSEATWDLLTPEDISSIDYTYLGPQNIRGEDHPLSLYLLNAVPGRDFGPLRRPPETIGDNRAGKDNESTANAFHAFALRRCYEHFPPDQRVEEVLHMARVWGILIPPRGSSQEVSDEDYANQLIDLIAERIVQDERNDGGGDVESTFDNMTIMMNMNDGNGFDTDTFDQPQQAMEDDAFTQDTVEVAGADGFGAVGGFDDDDDDFE